MRTRSCALGIAIAMIAAVVPAVAMAQPSYELLRSFVKPPAAPLHLVELEPGVFAAATQQGGSADRGAIVQLDRRPDGSFSTTVLHSFAGGETASSLIRGADGAIYGTTARDIPTAGTAGTAFRLSPAGAFTTLREFTDHEGSPTLEVRVGNGDFYGTQHVFPVFRMTPDGSVNSVPVLLVPAPSVRHRMRLAQAPNGDVFGLMDATIVKIVSDSDVTIVRELTSGGYVTDAHSSLVASADGNLYVAASDASSLPVVLRVTPAGVLSVVRSGKWAATLMEASDGQLYGLSYEPSNSGSVSVVFQMTKTGGYTVLHRFSFWDGEGGGGSLVQGTSGSLFGTWGTGGTSRRGVVYEISATGFAVRSHFSDPMPLKPSGPLVRGPDGALYGTTQEGGDYNVGTVFRMTEAGALTVLHSFRYWDGVSPSGVVLGNDGSFYGTTPISLIGRGSFFKITPGGAFTLLHIFAAAQGGAPHGLLLASDGNFYGTTGGWWDGTVFRISPSGAFSVLHAFSTIGGSLGSLAQGADGALYGTRARPADTPAAFRLTLAGAFESWQPFGSLRNPRGLIRATDGIFYGTSLNEVFRMTAAGDVTVVTALPRSVVSAISTFPGGLMQGSDGRLYGTTFYGGAADFGTVFGVTPEGAYEMLHSFSRSDGEKPGSALVETTPGTFYGTTPSGGPGLGGVIFRLVMNPPPF